MKKVQSVEVIDGGIGCQIASGVTGVVVAREESITSAKYHGEYEGIVARLYVKDALGNYYGLCEECIVKFW